MRTLFSLILLLFFLVTAGTAQAAELESTTDMYLRAVWGLSIVVGIMLIIYALVRKRFSLLTNKEDSKIKVLEMRPLMPKKTLCLIEIEGQQILLGITGDSINHLATIKNGSSSSFPEHLTAAQND